MTILTYYKVFILFIIFTASVSCCTASGNYKQTQEDRKSINKEKYRSKHSFADMVKWLWEMETVKWPEWIEDPVQPAPPDSAGDGNLRVTYINHATVLIQIDRMNILTDPVWSDNVGPVSWLSVKRVRAPGVKLDSLPKIDVILISHDHYDHLDLPTMKKLYKMFKPEILTGTGIKKILKKIDIPVTAELEWWEEKSVRGIKFVFVPALHDSGRGLFDSGSSLWGGWVIESGEGNIYFAGDTGFDDHFNEIKKKFSGFILTILPVGNYEKRWFMKNQHMNPEDAANAHILLKSAQSIGIHFATFAEHPEQAVDDHEKDLLKAIKKYNLSESEFRILKFGQGIDIMRR